MALVELAKQSDLTALDVRVTEAEADIVSLAAALGVGYVFFETLAEMNASLDHDPNILGQVTRDGVNNGIYVFDGAAWEPYEYDRVALLETAVEATTELLSGIATIGYPITVEESVPLPDGPVHMLSTFSGRGSPIRDRGPFNRISFYVYPWDPAFPATQAWVRIRKVDKDGDIVYDSGDWFPITAPQDVETLIDHDLGETIDLPDELWAEYFTDGKIGGRHISNQNAYYPEADYPLGAYSRVIDAGDPPPMIDSVTPGVIAYFKLSYVDYADPEAHPNPDFVEEIIAAIPGAEDLPAIPLMVERDFEELESLHNLPLSGCEMFIVPSTITSWDSPVGPAQNIHRVRTKLQAYDEDYPVTQARIYLFELTSDGGELIGDTGDFDVVAPIGETIDIQRDFPAAVVNAGAVNLVALLKTNGRIGRFGADTGTLYPTPTFPLPRYSTSTDLENTATNAAPTTAYGYYFELITLDENAPTVRLTEEFKEILEEELEIGGADADAEYLPAMPPVLYGNPLVQTNAYLRDLAHNDTGGRFLPEVLASVGRQLEECYRLEPEDADEGEYPVTLTLYARGDVAYETEALIRITPESAAAGTRKILMIGDSLTAGGYTVDRMLAVAALDASTALTFIGTQGTGLSKHEGHAGKTIDWFHSDPDSPLVFDDELDFAQYLSSNVLDTPDLTLFLLGINDNFLHSLTGQDLVDWAYGEFAKLDEIMAQALVVNPSMKFGICTITPPFGQDAWSNNYPTLSRHAYVRKVFTYRRAEHAYFAEGEAEGKFLVPTGSCIDTARAAQVGSPEPAFAHDTTKVVRTGFVTKDIGNVTAGAELDVVFDLPAATFGVVDAGDVVALMPPSALNAGLFARRWWINANNQVTVTFRNETGSAIDAASLSYGFMVTTTSTLTRQSNGVHPPVPGYNQLADTMYAAMKYILD